MEKKSTHIVEITLTRLKKEKKNPLLKITAKSGYEDRETVKPRRRNKK